MSKSFLIDTLIHSRPKVEPIDPPPPLIPSQHASSPSSREGSPVRVSPVVSPTQAERHYSHGSATFCTCCMPKTQHSGCQCQICMQDSTPMSPMFASYPYGSPYRESSICSRRAYDREVYKVPYPSSAINIQECPPHLLPSYSKSNFFQFFAVIEVALMH